MFWSFGETKKKNVPGWILVFNIYLYIFLSRRLLIGGGGDMVIEDWQRQSRAVRQHFLGGIRNVSFSQCSAVTWDSVIDCGGAC